MAREQYPIAAPQADTTAFAQLQALIQLLEMAEVDAAEDQAEEGAVLPRQTMSEIDGPFAGGVVLDGFAQEGLVRRLVAERGEIVAIGDIDVGSRMVAREIDEPPIRCNQRQ